MVKARSELEELQARNADASEESNESLVSLEAELSASKEENNRRLAAEHDGFKQEVFATKAKLEEQVRGELRSL